MKESLDNITNLKPNSPDAIAHLQNNLSNTKHNNTSKNEDIVNFTSKQNRSTTPDYRYSSHQKNRLPNFGFNPIRSSKSFYKSKNFSPDTKDQRNLSLRNEFQMNIGKLNSNSTKEIAFTELKDIILNNVTEDALRVFIGSLSSFDQNSTLHAKEIQVWLYGFIANTFKENLMDPWDRPVNIVKTINRMLGHIRSWYWKENSYPVHKACARSMIDLYDECMPKDNIKAVELIFIEPWFSIMLSGVDKCSQEGAGICLSDLICHLGLNPSEWNEKWLNSLDEKLIFLTMKSTLDNPFIFESLYNLIQFIEFDKFTNNLKEIYDRLLSVLHKKHPPTNNGNRKNNSNTINLMKTNTLNILKLIADKWKCIADISIGYYQPDVITTILSVLKEKNPKLQSAGVAALNSWKELEWINMEMEHKKGEIEQCDVYNKQDLEGVKKMDKLNYLRNLAKMAKAENKNINIDYDSELPEKRKEEVYKKGISNILQLSKFYKYKNNTSLSNCNSNVCSNWRTSSKDMKTWDEIKDYLKNSSQVKKYDKTNGSNMPIISNSIKRLEQLGEVKEEILENNKQTFEEEKGVVSTNLANNVREQENLRDNRFDINKQNENNQRSISYDQENKMKNHENEDENNYNNRNCKTSFPQRKDWNQLNQIKDKLKNQFLTLENNNDSINNNNNDDSIYDENVDITNIDRIQQNSHKGKKSIKKQTLPKIQKQHEQITSKPSEQSAKPTQLKSVLTSWILDNLLKQYTEFEKKLNSKLYDLETKINDIYLKLSEYHSNPNILPPTNHINKMDDPINISQQTDTSKYYHINNEKIWAKTILNPAVLQPCQTFQQHQKSELNRDEIYDTVITSLKKEIVEGNMKKPPPLTDSQIGKVWKEALYQIEHNNPDEGYNMILNSGDDIYLLRLVCITGPVFNKLTPDVAKRVWLRINMISRSHQIQTLLLSLIRNSISYNIFNWWNKNEQNDILDSLFEFSGLNTKLGGEAAELYTRLTK